MDRIVTAQVETEDSFRFLDRRHELNLAPDPSSTGLAQGTLARLTMARMDHRPHIYSYRAEHGNTGFISHDALILEHNAPCFELEASTLLVGS